MFDRYKFIYFSVYAVFENRSKIHNAREASLANVQCHALKKARVYG